MFLEKNKKILQQRFLIIKLIREFFAKQKFAEIDAPIIVSHAGQEPNIAPMDLKVHNEKGTSFTGYLHTSPEYAMKKMLAVGFDKIFYLGKCFRDYESFGDTHNPEFTMAEWYRTNCDYKTLMEDIKSLFIYLEKELKKKKIKTSKLFNLKTISCVTMKEIWKEKVGVNLDDFLTQPAMLKLCKQLGFKPRKNESYEILFYRIFLNKIEEKLTGLTLIYEYPAPMASLAALCKNKNYAQRFELYANDLELANGFTELTDAKEQVRRFNEEQKTRKKEGKPIFPIDKNFISAVEYLPKSTGVALGVDRLIMIFLACQNINDVLVLPAAKQFK